MAATRFFTIIGVICFCLATANAEENKSITTLDDAVRDIWQDSPQLHAQKNEVFYSEVDRFRRFLPNEPQGQWNSIDSHAETSIGGSLTAALPFKTVAFSALDTAKFHGQKAELAAKKYDLTKIITDAYLDCASNKALVDVQTVTYQDLLTLSNTLRILYESGHATQAEKISAELQTRQTHMDLVAANDRYRVFCQKLTRLVAPRTVEIAQLNLPDDLEENLLNEIGDSTADQNRNLATIDVAGANRFTAWWGQIPDVTFNLSRNHYLDIIASPTGKEFTTTYGLSVTLPILFPFYEMVEAQRNRSQAIIDQDVARLALLTSNADQEDGGKEYRRNKARLQELRERDLALAEALVDSTFSAYKSGRLGYAELILSRKTLAELKTQDIQLRASIIRAHLRCLSNCGPASQTSSAEEKM